MLGGGGGGSASLPITSGNPNDPEWGTSDFERRHSLMATVATWLVYALAFALMYHYLPDRSVGWRPPGCSRRR